MARNTFIQFKSTDILYVLMELVFQMHRSKIICFALNFIHHDYYNDDAVEKLYHPGIELFRLKLTSLMGALV